MIVGPNWPVCSRCVRPHRIVVVFMARTEHAKVTGHRGGARSVRLCRRCVRSLNAEIATAVRRRRR